MKSIPACAAVYALLFVLPCAAATNAAPSNASSSIATTASAMVSNAFTAASNVVSLPQPSDSDNDEDALTRTTYAVREGMLLPTAWSSDKAFGFHVAASGVLIADENADVVLATPRKTGFEYGGTFSFDTGVDLGFTFYDCNLNWEAFVMPVILGGLTYGAIRFLDGTDDAAIPIAAIAATYGYLGSLEKGLFDIKTAALAYAGGLVGAFGAYWGSVPGSTGTWLGGIPAAAISMIQNGGSTYLRVRYKSFPNIGAFAMDNAYTVDLDVLNLGAVIDMPFSLGYRLRHESRSGFSAAGVRYEPVTINGRNSSWDYFPESFISINLFDVISFGASISGYKVYMKSSTVKMPWKDVTGWRDLSYSGSISFDFSVIDITYTYSYAASTQRQGEIAASLFRATTVNAHPDVNLQWKNTAHAVNINIRLTDRFLFYINAAYITADRSLFDIGTTGVIGGMFATFHENVLTEEIGLKFEYSL